MSKKTRITRAATSALLLAGIACGALSSGIADAHGGHRTHFGFAFAFPAPIYYPAPYYAPYPRYYYPPPTAYVPPPSAPEYIEQNPPTARAPSAPSAPPPPSAPSAPSQGTANYWYFCPDSQTYYPYVQTCASQWQQVVPRSGPPS